MRVITIRIMDETLEKIDKLTERFNVDRSTMIRMLIEKGLREELIKLAIDMYLNDEVTLERAAEIAGIPLLDFVVELRKRGVKHKEDEEIEELMKVLKKKGLI